MFALVKNQDNTQPYVAELIADTPDDIAKLPTHYNPGSTVIVASDSSVYILNTQHEWVKL